MYLHTRDDVGESEHPWICGAAETGRDGADTIQ